MRAAARHSLFVKTCMVPLLGRVKPPESVPETNQPTERSAVEAEAEAVTVNDNALRRKRRQVRDPCQATQQQVQYALPRNAHARNGSNRERYSVKTRLYIDCIATKSTFTRSRWSR